MKIVSALLLVTCLLVAACAFQNHVKVIGAEATTPYPSIAKTMISPESDYSHGLAGACATAVGEGKALVTLIDGNLTCIPVSPSPQGGATITTPPLGYKEVCYENHDSEPVYLSFTSQCQ